MTTNSRKVAEPAVGDELTPMSWETGPANWNRFDAIIENVDIRFKQPNVKGQTVNVEGRVTAVDNGGAHTRVDLDLAVNADDGSQLSTGAAVVRIGVDES